MNTVHEKISELIAAHALGSLDAEEASEVEAHLLECNICRMEAVQLSGIVSLLPLALTPTEPSSQVKDRLLAAARADSETHGSRLRVGNTASVQRLKWRTVGVSLVAAAAVALLIWNVNLRQQVHNQQSQLALAGEVNRALANGASVAHFHSTPDALGASAELVQPRSQSQAFVVVTGLSRNPAGHAYELWLVKGSKPSRAGVFGTTGKSTQIWRVAKSTRGYPAATVTLERGTSGRSRPSGPQVLVASLET